MATTAVSATIKMAPAKLLMRIKPPDFHGERDSMVLLSLAEAAMWMIQYDRATVVPNKMELVGFDIDYLMALNTSGCRGTWEIALAPAPKDRALGCGVGPAGDWNGRRHGFPAPRFMDKVPLRGHGQAPNRAAEPETQWSAPRGMRGV
jgi:hypothetical protein